MSEIKNSEIFKEMNFSWRIINLFFDILNNLAKEENKKKYSEQKKLFFDRNIYGYKNYGITISEFVDYANNVLNYNDIIKEFLENNYKIHFDPFYKNEEMIKKIFDDIEINALNILSNYYKKHMYDITLELDEDYDFYIKNYSDDYLF